MIDKRGEAMEAAVPGPKCDDTTTSRSPRRSSRLPEKYGLRPRTHVRRLQVERAKEEVSPSVARATKVRPAPLSKYRRKTANARERHRMKEINDAFETLRRVLPDICSRKAAAAMTKITTLKLAVNYIRALSRILQEGHPGDISFFDGLGLDELSMDACSPSSPVHPHAPTVFQYTAHAAHAPAFPTMTSCPSLPQARPLAGSNSDLSELLSDDSCVFEDNLGAFDDIPALPEADPFALLLSHEDEAIAMPN